MPGRTRRDQDQLNEQSEINSSSFLKAALLILLLVIFLWFFGIFNDFGAKKQSRTILIPEKEDTDTYVIPDCKPNLNPNSDWSCEPAVCESMSFIELLNYPSTVTTTVLNVPDGRDDYQSQWIKTNDYENVNQFKNVYRDILNAHMKFQDRGLDAKIPSTKAGFRDSRIHKNLEDVEYLKNLQALLMDYLSSKYYIDQNRLDIRGYKNHYRDDLRAYRSAKGNIQTLYKKILDSFDKQGGLDNQYHSWQKSKEQLELSLGRINADINSGKKEANIKIDDLSIRIAQMRLKLKDNEGVANKINELNILIKQYENKIPDLERQKEYAVSQIKKIKEGATGNGPRVGKLTKNRDDLNGYISLLISQINVSSAKDNGLDEIVHRLGSECNDADCDKKRIKDFQDKLDQIRLEMKRILMNPHISTEHKNSLIKKANLDYLVKTYKNLIENYEEMRRIAKSYKSQTFVVAKLKVSLEKTRTRLRNIEAELDNIRSSEVNYEESIRSWEIKIPGYQVKIDNFKEQIRVLLNELNQYKVEVGVTPQMLEDLVRKASRLRYKLDSDLDDFERKKISIQRKLEILTRNISEYTPSEDSIPELIRKLNFELNRAKSLEIILNKYTPNLETTVDKVNRDTSHILGLKKKLALLLKQIEAC